MNRNAASRHRLVDGVLLFKGNSRRMIELFLTAKQISSSAVKRRLARLLNSLARADVRPTNTLVRMPTGLHLEEHAILYDRAPLTGVFSYVIAE